MIKVPQSFFKSVNSEIRRFVWQGEKPRLKMQELPLDPEEGGLALGKINIYYQVALLEWLTRSSSESSREGNFYIRNRAFPPF